VDLILRGNQSVVIFIFIRIHMILIKNRNENLQGYIKISIFEYVRDVNDIDIRHDQL